MDFFELVFQNAPPDTWVEIAGPITHRSFILPGTTPNTPNIDTDYYYGVALRKTKASGKEAVYGTRVLWADVDRPQIPQPTFPPSLVVFSGGGHHLYWLLDDWLVDTECAESANKSVAEDVGGDNCWNIDRLLRVPGTINTKYGVGCALRAVRPEVAYKIDDFKVLAALDSKTKHKIRTGDRRGYKSRSERDWAIVDGLCRAGASDELISLLFKYQPCGDKFVDPETPPEYLSHTIERVRQHVANTGGRRKRANADIEVGEDGYYIERARGRARLSTFVFEPHLLLEGDKEDVLVGDVSASEYVWKDVTLPRSAFNDRKQLDKHLTTSAWVWLGRDDDVRMLLPFLLKILQDKGLPRSKATSVLGRHHDKYVGNSQTVLANDVFTGVDGPLVFLTQGREIPVVEYRTGPLDLTNLGSINRPEVVWPVLGWFSATPYKPLLENLKVRFPILNVYGTRGSGKTSLIRIMQRMFGYVNPAAYDAKTTRFVTLSLLGCSNSVPVSFSEYRHSTGVDFMRFVLLAYDTGHDQRGRGDQTTVDYPLSAPFSVDGEDIIADSAAKERIVGVNMHPESIAEGSDAYHAFRALEAQPLENFSLGYIQYCLRTDVGVLLQHAQEQIAEAFPETLPVRVRNNMTISLTGLLSYQGHTGHPLPDVREMFEPVLRSVWSPELGRSPTLVDEFVESLANAAAGGNNMFVYYTEETVIWFQLATAFQWWLRSRRMSGQLSLDRDAIRNQLLERDVEKGGKGQYTIKPRQYNNVWCYGIDLVKASEAGLDVPAKIAGAKVIHF